MYVPATYTKGRSSFEDYALQEFKRLSDYLGTVETGFAFVPQRAAPQRPRDFMVVLADGVNWDPLTKSQPHLVVYHGGTWKAVV